MKRKISIIAFFAVAVLVLVGIFSIFASTVNTPTTLSVSGKNLSFSDSVYIVFYVEAEGVDAKDVELLVWNTPKDSYTINDSPKKLSYLRTEKISGKDYLCFEYRDLAAKNMADTIYARAFVPSVSGGHYSDLTNYSVLQYAYNKLGKTGTATTNADLKALLTDMLEYGAAAQIEFNHKTDRLATSDFKQVKVNGGFLPDGTERGFFLKNDTVILTAQSPAEGMVFLGWKEDSSNEIFSTDKTIEVKIQDSNVTYTAEFTSAS